MIVHVFNSSIVSGPETLVLPALRNLGEPVVIIFLAEARLGEKSIGPIEYARKLGHRVHIVPVRSRWDSRAFVELRNSLDGIQPRISHAHDVKASVYLLEAKKIRPGFPGAVVSTHHGAAFRRGKIRLYEEYYVRRVLPHFDRVLSVCEADRRSISRRGVEEKNISVHLNGATGARVSSNERSLVAALIRAEWRKKASALPASDEAIFLGAVARLSKEKRHDRMLRVLVRLNRIERSKPAVLLCFGTGPEEVRLRKLAKTLGAEKFVFWMGYSNSVREEMAGFDLLLCLSDGEGIPMSLLEAGWAATPVLSTSVGGVPDLISSPEEGFLVEKESSDAQIADRLNAVLLDRVGLARTGSIFQARVSSRFSQDAWLKRLGEIYTETVKPS